MDKNVILEQKRDVVKPITIENDDLEKSYAAWKNISIKFYPNQRLVDAAYFSQSLPNFSFNLTSS